MYDFVAVNPVTTIGLDTPLAVRVVSPDAVHDTEYPVTTEPPFDPGATNTTLNARGPLSDATTLVGAPGTPTATTELDAPDALDEPAAFVAVTEHVYVFAADNAVTKSGLEAPAPLRVVPPSLDTHDAA